jgi:hypothetical protein
MTWDEASSSFHLSSGRVLPVTQGIMGLSMVPDLDGDILTEGAQRFFWFGDVPYSDGPLLTDAERREIAEFMCTRWQAWAKGELVFPRQPNDDHHHHHK